MNSRFRFTPSLVILTLQSSPNHRLGTREAKAAISSLTYQPPYRGPPAFWICEGIPENCALGDSDTEDRRRDGKCERGEKRREDGHTSEGDGDCIFEDNYSTLTTPSIAPRVTAVPPSQMLSTSPTQ